MEFVDSYGNKKHIETRFHPESRMEYTADSVEQLFENDYELLKHYITHHQQRQVPRLVELKHYAEGINHTILEGESRRNEEDMADVRTVHNYPKKIIIFRRGYLVGNPIQIEYEDGNKDSATDKALEEMSALNNLDSLNRQVVTNFLKYGKAFEIGYINEEGDLNFKRLSNEHAFVVRTNDLDERKLAGVYYYQSNPLDEKTLTVEVRDATYVYILQLALGEESKISETEKREHGFNHVPIIEHKYDEDGIGVYETELPLIDLYDMAQSDTGNYMADLADAILFIMGDVEFPPDVDTAQKQLDYMKAMRKGRLMQLVAPKDVDGKEGSVDAKYLYKQYDVSGTEAFKSRIHDDIHDLTLTPDVSDENFGGNASGEAMKYKHFGLDQDRASTESLFESTLKERYQLIADVYNDISDENGGAFTEFDLQKLKITFTPNLPKSDSEVANMAKSLYGILSDETVLKMLNTVTNVNAEEELRRIDEQDSERYPPPRIERRPTEISEADPVEESEEDNNGQE